MKTILYCITFFIFGLKNICSQSVCYIALNMNDCMTCIRSYEYISNIDPRLNPIIILDQLDTLTANYFLNDYLKLKNIPYEIDHKKYAALKDQYDQVKLNYSKDGQVKLEFIVKELPEKIDLLNPFASKSSSNISMEKLSLLLKDSMKNKFFGRKLANVYNNNLTIYSTLSQHLLSANMETGEIKTYQVNDSVVYEKLFPPKNANEFMKQKRRFYKNEVKYGIKELAISNHFAYKDHIYLYATVIDYKKMKSKQELIDNDIKEVRMKALFYILECKMQNNDLVILNKIEIDRQYRDSIVYDYEFRIVNDVPVFFYTDNVKLSFYPKYIDVLKNTRNNTYNFKKTDLMYLSFNGNSIYNQFTYNRLSNILIDNRSGKSFKLSEYGYDTVMYYDIKSFSDSNACIVLLNVLTQELTVYKVDVNKNQVVPIKKYHEGLSENNQFLFSYLDAITNTLHIYFIRNNKEVYYFSSLKLGS